MDKKFAKIFDTELYGQILVTNDSRDGLPSINAFFHISDDFGVCEMSCKYADTDDGWERCDAMFEKVDEPIAISIVAATINDMRDMPMIGEENGP